MTLYTAIFYLVAAVIFVSTGLAITRGHPIHAVIYLIVSFLGSGVLFFLLGAPFLAAVEIIVYAGAIMVLFLFVIMMFKVQGIEHRGRPWRLWGPAILTAILFLSVAGLLAFGDPSSSAGLTMKMVSPKTFGRFVFEKYWLAIEMISLLLFLGLVAAIHLARAKREDKAEE